MPSPESIGASRTVFPRLVAAASLPQLEKHSAFVNYVYLMSFQLSLITFLKICFCFTKAKHGSAKKCWTVLRGQYLCYFKSEDDMVRLLLSESSLHLRKKTCEWYV